MATATIVVVVLVVVASIAAAAAVVLLLVRRLTSLARDLQDLEQRISPALSDLQRDAEVTSSELARVSASLDELGQRRRRGRRGR